MSDPEVSPVRSLEPLPEQPPLAAPSDMHTAMYLMGNHPAKMVSLLALESFPPGEYIGRNMLAQRLEAMKEGADGWMPQPTTLLDYCRDNLGPLGFIDSIKPERPSGTKKDMPSGELRLSEKGRLLGPLVAGPLLSFELETLEADYDKNNLRLPLQVAMGKTYYAKGRLKGGPTRFSIKACCGNQRACRKPKCEQVAECRTAA